MALQIRFLLYIFLFLNSLNVFSQNSEFKLCYSTLPKNSLPLYYSLNAKYPIASETLVQQVNKFTLTTSSQNGYITVRFFVNCKGEIGDFEVIETNNQYESAVFGKAYINEIIQFIKTLKNWPIPNYPDTKFVAEYRSYLSFRISDGKVVEIIP